jgi:hypothetical protein
MAHLAEAGKLTLEDVKELEVMLAERGEQQSAQIAKRKNRTPK